MEAPDDAQAAWKTRHFALLSDDAIRKESIQQFATTLESLPTLLEDYPLPLWSPSADQDAVIRLCRDADRYEALGGPPDTAGFFNGRKNEILIRADLFLSPPGGSARLQQAPDEGLLVHESCHLLMAGTLRGTRPWLKEGLAEYFSVAHQRGGLFRFDLFDRNLPKQLRRHLALQTGDTVRLPALQEILELSDRDWNRALREAAPEERYLPYAVSLLFVHYQLHGGEVRRDAFAGFVNELSQRHPKRRNQPEFEVDDPLEVEKQLIRYWSSRGLRFEFEAAKNPGGRREKTPSTPTKPAFPRNPDRP
ncbi:MAG: hypothetical protein AAGI48_05405 [Verrucomicrobiota bacterium]